jgi:hypothetical protein
VVPDVFLEVPNKGVSQIIVHHLVPHLQGEAYFFDVVEPNEVQAAQPVAFP